MWPDEVTNKEYKEVLDAKETTDPAELSKTPAD